MVSHPVFAVKNPTEQVLMTVSESKQRVMALGRTSAKTLLTVVVVRLNGLSMRGITMAVTAHPVGMFKRVKVLYAGASSLDSIQNSQQFQLQQGEKCQI